MLKTHSYRIAGCLLGVLWIAAALAQDTQPPLAPQQRMEEQEQTQAQAGQRLEVARDTASELIEDLRSNNLYEQTQGPRLKTIGTVVGQVSQENIPPAIESLRQARQKLSNPRPSLDTADAQITIILQRLESLLKEVHSASQTERLLAELRVIIARQESLRVSTGDWGRQLLENIADLEAKAGELSRNQADLGKVLGLWAQKLKTAADGESDPPTKQKLTAADKVMVEKKAVTLVDSLSGRIDAKKPIEATAGQDSALEILRQVAKLLTDDNFDFAADQQNMVPQLQNLLDQQRALDAQEQAANDQLEAQAPQFQAEQKALQAALQQTMTAMPKKIEQLQVAQAAMEKAQKDLGEPKMPNDDAAQALAKALEELKPDGGDPKDPDKDQGQGPPPPVLVVGPPQPQQKPPQQPTPALESLQGPRTFASTDKAAGSAAARGTSKTTTLGERPRQAQFESYVNDLPAEYRGLLQDYYKALSE